MKNPKAIVKPTIFLLVHTVNHLFETLIGFVVTIIVAFVVLVVTVTGLFLNLESQLNDVIEN